MNGVGWGKTGTAGAGVVVAAIGTVFFSERDEYIAAVVAAPAAADMPAMMARVVVDMIAVGDERD